MGHKSKFTFPLPGRKSKQRSTTSSVSSPLSKVQKILGTGENSPESPTIPTRGGPFRQWDAASTSGISISISESSASVATHDIALGGLDAEYGTAEASPGHNAWDQESDIIPRQLDRNDGQQGRGIRAQRSAATLQHDAGTDASSFRRRQSTASTIFSYYERTKVPLAISQQTSNSAIAKGPRTKAESLLDMDGTLAGHFEKKRKPARLDLSMLMPRSRRGQSAQATPVLGNDYVMKSPSVMSHRSRRSLKDPPPPPMVRYGSTPGDSRRIIKPPPSVLSPPNSGSREHPHESQDTAGLRQLYDHYEQMSFRIRQLPEEETPSENHQIHNSEPSPPLTTASSLATPVAPTSHKQASRTPYSPPRHEPSRKQNKARTSTRPDPVALPVHRPTTRDYASSVSSRQTSTSKISRADKGLPSPDWQKNSVLSLSDSESDEATFSDSGPKSSVSSHGNTSHDDVSISPMHRKMPKTRVSPVQESASSRSKHSSFATLNDYLAIPRPGHKGHSARPPSSSTLRSSSSTTSTATATPLHISKHMASLSSRASRMSISTVGSESLASRGPRTPLRPRQVSYGVQEAQAIAFIPLASTAQAATSVPIALSNDGDEPSRQASDRRQHTSRSQEQPTPPLSPASVDRQFRSPELTRSDSVASLASEGHNARFMAVTRQEQALLAALRKKRANMRENIIAEIESEKTSIIGSDAASIAGSQKSAKVVDHGGKRATKPLSNRRGASVSSGPPTFPKRGSSLITGLQDFTHCSTAQDFNILSSRASSRTDEPRSNSRNQYVDNRPRSSLSNLVPRSEPKEHRERVLLYLDLPESGVNVDDTAEPSPGLSDYMDFDRQSDDEARDERRSRSRAKKTGAKQDSGSWSPRTSSMHNPFPELLLHNRQANQAEVADADADFDGFSDVMSHDRNEQSPERYREESVARPDSPVASSLHYLLVPSVKTIKARKSRVRLSAVGRSSSPMDPAW